MANCGLHRVKQKSLAVAITLCSFGLLYGLYWHSAKPRPRLLSDWLPRLSRNTSNHCLNQLLLDFDIVELNLTAPTYVRLAQPKPISGACAGLIAKSDKNASDLTNFVKHEHLNSLEQVEIHSIVHQLYRNFSQRGLELFLAGGSLLGSVRHFGHFPWDADADVMILTHQKPQVRQLLIDLSATGKMRFADTARIFGHWQIGIMCPDDRNKSSNGTQVVYHWVVPDITYPTPVAPCRTIVDFFFGTPGTKSYTRTDYPGSFPMEDVYPLTVRPYGQYLMPVPRHADKFLAAVYGKDYELKCYFKYFGNKSYKCAALRSMYPFVSHLQLAYDSSSELRADLLVHGSNMTAIFIPAQA